MLDINGNYYIEKYFQNKFPMPVIWQRQNEKKEKIKKNTRKKEKKN